MFWEHQGQRGRNSGRENAYKLSTTSAYPRGGGDLPLPTPCLSPLLLHSRKQKALQFEVLALCISQFYTSLSFLPPSLARSVFFIASCHLPDAQWGENVTQQDRFCFLFFIFLAFNFLLESLLGCHWFLVALGKPWRDSRSLRPATRLESHFPRIMDWHLCVTVGHVPKAGCCSHWWPMGNAPSAPSLKRARYSVNLHAWLIIFRSGLSLDFNINVQLHIQEWFLPLSVYKLE